jgi:hypothetical protein
LTTTVFPDFAPSADQCSGDGLDAPAEAQQGECPTPFDDFLLLRSRDLQHVLMMWTRSIELRGKGGAWLHTEKTALGMLRNRFNSAPSLSDLIALVIADGNVKSGNQAV